MHLSDAKQAIHTLVKRHHGVPHDRGRLEVELAEILLYLLRTANRVGIDLAAAADKRVAYDARHQPKSVPDINSPTAASADVRSSGEPLRILIVEDEGIVAADLQQVLNGLGYNAFAVASSGAEAVACAQEIRPDIALMDIRIAGLLDGIETAAQLRETFGTAIIFLTAHADDLTFERAKHSDPDGYLLKPVSVSALKATIELTAHRHRMDPSATHYVPGT